MLGDSEDMDILRKFVLLCFCLGVCEAQTVWELKNGRQIEGTVLRIDPPGHAVIRTGAGVSNVPLGDFTSKSIARLERQFAAVDIRQLAASNRSVATSFNSSALSGWSDSTPMQKSGVILFGVAFVILFFSYVLLLVAAFKENPVWGIAILLFGIAGLVFFILHFSKAKASLGFLVGGLLTLAGAIYFLSLGTV